MDFSFDETQKAVKQTIIEFAQKELNENMVGNDKEGKFSWEGWKKCAQQNILALPVPEKYGGVEADIITTILTMEGLGYGCEDNGLIFAINSQMWSCEIPILEFGTEAQKSKYLPQLCRGELIGGHAMTEADSGSDAFSLRTKAVKKGDRYILNGNKAFITNSPIADLLVVFAVTDESKGFAGVSAFIVEKGAPGFIVSEDLDKMGLRTAPIGYLIFEDCEVPAENLLGREGAGSAIFNSEMEWERSCLFACHVGVMERVLDKTVDYAKQRRQFGQSIGKFQGVSHKIAEMQMRIELSKLILYKIGWLKMQGKRGTLESAIAKLFISEAFVKTCLDAIQIHGANGYMREFNIERYLRDSIASTIYSGTSEIQKNIIAGWLGL
jgi:hypothetical protein